MLTMSFFSTQPDTPHSPWFSLALELVSLSLLGESSPTCLTRFLMSGSTQMTAGSIPFHDQVKDFTSSYLMIRHLAEITSMKYFFFCAAESSSASKMHLSCNVQTRQPLYSMFFVPGTCKQELSNMGASFPFCVNVN